MHKHKWSKVHDRVEVAFHGPWSLNDLMLAYHMAGGHGGVMIAAGKRAYQAYCEILGTQPSHLPAPCLYGEPVSRDDELPESSFVFESVPQKA